MPAHEDFQNLTDMHLKQELEAYVMEANGKILPEILGTLDRSDMKRAIVWVAALRAEYLKAVLTLTRLEGGQSDQKALENLVQRRQDYEEALAGVAALRHALSQGYITVDQD